MNGLPVDWSLDWFYWMFGCSCYGRCSACCSYTWFVWRFTFYDWCSLFTHLIRLKFVFEFDLMFELMCDSSLFLDKPESTNLWSVVISAFLQFWSHRSLCFSFIYYCLYNTNAVNYNTYHLCVSAGYVQPHGLQRRRYVFIMSRCLSRANTESSAGLASPLHTYYCEGIRWLRAIDRTTMCTWVNRGLFTWRVYNISPV